MAISFELTCTDEYVFVRCEGTFDMESMRRIYTNSVDAAAKAGLHATLIDVRGLRGEPPSILQRFELGVFVAELQRDRGRGIVIAGVGNRPMVHESKFGEIVARNRSANARIFTDIDEAIGWIQAKQALSQVPTTTVSARHGIDALERLATECRFETESKSRRIAPLQSGFR